MKFIIVILFVIILFNNFSNGSDIPFIDQQKLDELKAEHDNLLILDVREPSELYGHLGRIESAINIPLANIPDAFLAMSIPQDTPIVILCRTQNRSAIAYRRLKMHNYEHMHVLYGGMTDYKHR